MTITEGNGAIKSMEITDELLSLLRAINEKFNSGDGKPEDRASLGSKGKEREDLESGNGKRIPPGHQWYRRSLPGKDWCRKWSCIYFFRFGWLCLILNSG